MILHASNQYAFAYKSSAGRICAAVGHAAGRLPFAMLAALLAGLAVLVWPVPARAEAGVWVVKPGDVLSVLARRFDLEVEQLREWNDLKGDLLRVGQKLVLEPKAESREDDVAETASSNGPPRGASEERVNLGPEPVRNTGEKAVAEGLHEPAGEPESPERWTTHVVVRGDNLTAIARRCGVSVRDLLDWNPGTHPDRIRSGQKLRIRDAEAVSTDSGNRGTSSPEPAEDGAKPASTAGSAGASDDKAARRREPADPGGVYPVAEGDTLRSIARRFGISVQELLDWNPGTHPDRIRSGQKLRVGHNVRRISYRVRKGDTLASIGVHFGVTAAQIVAWNPKVNRDWVPAGRRLVIYTRRPRSYSESVGAPHRGRLRHGQRLPRNSGYEIRDRSRAWGTEETVARLVGAVEAVRRRHRGTPKLMVHDLSHRKGGRMSDHHSHQSGRDADLAYYQKDCAAGVCKVKPVSPAGLDVKRQWTLIRHWLRSDRVEAIFVDYKLQKTLYRYARRKGATAEQLQRWFQYPRGRDVPVGVIRHYRKHADHLHVRFACHKTDPECRTLRPLLMQARRD